MNNEQLRGYIKYKNGCYKWGLSPLNYPSDTFVSMYYILQDGKRMVQIQDLYHVRLDRPYNLSSPLTPNIGGKIHQSPPVLGDLGGNAN